MQEAIDKLNYWDDESWVLKRAQEGDIVTHRRDELWHVTSSLGAHGR